MSADAVSDAQMGHVIRAFKVLHPSGSKGFVPNGGGVIQGSREHLDFLARFKGTGADVVPVFRDRPRVSVNNARQADRVVDSAESMARSGVLKGELRVPNYRYTVRNA